VLDDVDLVAVLLGIIGEYLGRIYDEVKERPLFLIEKTWGLEESSEQ
jgi:dolichol-phosphate mannosyltransferase